MAFSKEDLESLVKDICKEITNQPDWVLEEEVLEICHVQHGVSVSSYVKSIKFYNSYCAINVAPESGSSYVDYEDWQIMLPYSSIEAIERLTHQAEQGEEPYIHHRLITTPGLGQFYDIENGYVYQEQGTDPNYIESPAAILSRMLGLLKEYKEYVVRSKDA